MLFQKLSFGCRENGDSLPENRIAYLLLKKIDTVEYKCVSFEC